MTTPLASEPMPGDGQVPYMSTLVDRLYGRLPEVYRTMDARDSCWQFKRYLGAALAQAGTIGDTVDAIAGSLPVGPATPEPWGLAPDELDNWRTSRQNVPSLRGDPQNAPVGWLQWMSQLVGASLDPTASEQEKRDTIIYATSGYRAGTKGAIADAAKSALTGTRYAQVLAHTKVSTGSVVAGGPWDITVVTRISETPDVSKVLGAILRKGVKPAGAVLYHQAYEAPWSNINPLTWAQRNALTWTQVEEYGL